MSLHRILRPFYFLAPSLFLLPSCNAPPPPHLTYWLRVSDSIPREMTVSMVVADLHRPYLDLRAHCPSNVMRVERLDVRTATGQPLRWTERAETTRVRGVPITMSTYRVLGPVPRRVLVSYRVSPGRDEGDAHIGSTGRCFGYLGPDFGLVTGRNVFLLPDNAEAIGSLEVHFSLPWGWSAAAP
jgi:hypothetical protein